MRRSNRVLAATALAACALAPASPGIAADDVGSAAARAAGALKRDAAPTSGPPSVADLEALERAVESVKDWLPFTQRNVIFVSRKAESFREGERRPTGAFDRGEVLRSYAEPLGYGLKPTPEGGFALQLTMDFAIKTQAGKILAGQDGFDKVNVTYANRYAPVFLNLSLNITGIEPGDYVLTYKLHDDTTGKVTSFEQPFSIRG